MHTIFLFYEEGGGISLLAPRMIGLCSAILLTAFSAIENAWAASKLVAVPHYYPNAGARIPDAAATVVATEAHYGIRAPFTALVRQRMLLSCQTGFTRTPRHRLPT